MKMYYWHRVNKTASDIKTTTKLVLDLLDIDFIKCITVEWCSSCYLQGNKVLVWKKSSVAPFTNMG